MANNIALIQDKNGNNTFPITHERAVRDSNGVTLETKLANLTPSGGDATNAVLFTAQNLTSAQKTQARSNIGAGTYSKPSNGIPKSDLASDAIPAPCISLTYSELYTLRANGTLTPGQTYRITDFVTTIARFGRSAGHPFDLIVTALDGSHIAEEAKAAHHSGDTYFANSDLDAWQIWYCLDNDSTRFNWVDTTNGKGVIYRMIDEFGNDAPFDFKNHLFAFASSWINNHEAWFHSNLGEIPESTVLFYTFTSYDIDEHVSSDASLDGSCWGNTFKPHTPNNGPHQTLGMLLMDGCHDNTFDANCQQNMLGLGCSYNSFGGKSTQNCLGSGCSYNTFGKYCVGNVLDSSSQHGRFFEKVCGATVSVQSVSPSGSPFTVLSGVTGTVEFTAPYQVAGMDESGNLQIWVPGPCKHKDDDDSPESYPPYETVDLGLPSGTLWAKANIGAGTQDQFGIYLAWGELASKTTYNWSTYIHGTENNLTKYNATDGRTELGAEDDAAFVLMGGNWHLPTQAQCEELLAYTTASNTTVEGVAGLLLTSTVNNNTIFFPYSGIYYLSATNGAVGEGFGGWASTRSSDKSQAFMYNGNSSGSGSTDIARAVGVTSRGVITPAASAVASTTVRYFGTSKIMYNNGVADHDYYYAIVDENTNKVLRVAMIEPTLDTASGKTIMVVTPSMSFGPVNQTVQISEGDWVLFLFSSANPTPIKLIPGTEGSTTFPSGGSTVKMEYVEMSTTNNQKKYYVLRKKYEDGVLVADYHHFGNVFNQDLEKLKLGETDVDGGGEIFHFVNRVVYSK